MKFIRYYKSELGYGRALWIGRVRFNSPGSRTPMWPFIRISHDENCNPVLTIHLWPLGGIDTWYRRHQRTDEDGICDECVQEIKELMEE